MTRRSILPTLAFALALAGCGGSGATEADEPTEATASTETETTVPADDEAPTAEEPAPEPLCLPITNGCGCAVDCGRALRALGARPETPDRERYEVETTDGSTLEASLGNRCHGQEPCEEGPSFYDHTACNQGPGNCSPTRFDHCQMTDGACAPAP